MKDFSETSICRRIVACGKALGSCCVGHECDVSLSLYADRHTQSPECTHRIKASGRHPLLLPLLVFVGVLCLVGLLKKLCCLFFEK